MAGQQRHPCGGRYAYAAAGILGRDGTYVYALDAGTGEVVWKNTASGHLDAKARKGVSVMGSMTIANGKLWLAGGNEVSPAAYDLRDGRYIPGPKPERRPNEDVPRGREIGVFAGRWIVTGGRILYSDPGKVISSGQFEFTRLDADRERLRQSYPLHRAGIPAVWDDTAHYGVAFRYNDLKMWRSDEFEAFAVFAERMEEDSVRRARPTTRSATRACTRAMTSDAPDDLSCATGMSMPWP